MKGKTFKPTDYEVFGGLDVDKRSFGLRPSGWRDFIEI
jgi:hypothetical protein